MNTDIYCIDPKPVSPTSGTVAIWRGDHALWFNQRGQHWVSHFYSPLKAFSELNGFLAFYDFQVCSQKQALLHLYKIQ